MSKNKYTISFLVTSFKENDVWTLFNWLNTENVELSDVNHPMYRAIESGGGMVIDADSFYNHEQDAAYLIEKRFLVKNDEEVMRIVRGLRDKDDSGENLGITLMPVNQGCNFRCIYCHEDHSKNNYMNEIDSEILLKHIEGRGLKSFRSDYFGGEPLLNTDFILNFQHKLRHISKVQGFSLELSSMTTNGYLLNVDLFQSLLNAGVATYQITLDGSRENHDALRPLATGGKTFDVIYNNLKEISKLDDCKHFSITLRMNYNYNNANSKDRRAFLEMLKNDFGGDDRFIIMVQPISNWKKESVRKDLYIPEESMSEVQISFEKEIEGSGLDTTNMTLFSGLGAHCCYAGKSNNCVVYPYDETIGAMPVEKCTLSIGNTINRVGQIDKSGTLRRNDNWETWTEDVLFKEEKCRSCFLVLHCFSKSCALENFTQNSLVCPREKFQEVELAKRLLQFIEKG